MSQPIDPWTYLRHQTEKTDRLLRQPRTERGDRITVRHRTRGPRD